MAMKKSGIEEIIESGQAPAVAGKKKTYLIDHKTIWDPSKGKIDPKTGEPKGAALVTATEFTEEWDNSGVSGSTPVMKRRGVIETADPKLQGELEKRGYKPGLNKKMHEPKTGIKVGPQGSIKTGKQARKENAEL